MTCKEYALLLHDLLDGLLAKPQADMMEAHAAECPSCQAVRVEMAALLKDLQTLDTDVRIPDDCAGAWRSAVREEAVKHPMKTSTYKRAKAWAAIVAATLCLVSGTALMRAGYIPGTPEYQARTGNADINNQYFSNRQMAYPDSIEDDMEEAYDAKYFDEGAASPMASTLMSMPEAATGATDMPEIMPEEDAGVMPKIIRTASLRISSTAFDTDSQALLALIDQAGGWIAYESLYGEPLSVNPEGGRSGHYTLRVPTQSLDSLLTAMEGIGVTESKNISAQDISDRYYDTESRLRMYETQRDRLMALLENAETVADMLEIEGKLGEILYQIESLTGSLRKWDSRIEYSELSVTIVETADKLRVQPTKETLGERMREGLYASLNAFVRFGRDTVVFLAVALPWVFGTALVTGIILFALRLIKKRRKP